MILTLDRSAGVEVALALINMTIVAVASWRFRPVGRWATVGLATAGWSAAQLVGGGVALSEIPSEALAWHVGLRLAALASVAATVGAGRAAVRRLLRTEDALALSLLRERDSARRDRLTRLWNSRYLHEALEREIYRCRRYGRPFGLLVVDLDGFKAVNDTAGHEAGDRVLQAVGRVIRENCRTTDIPARLGGDEFAVILPEASRLTVPRYALKLVDLVGALSFPPGQPRVTASVGAIAFERAPESVEAALAAADEAMYAAKREGKNRVVVHEAERVVNFVLDIETIPRDLRAEPRKIQEYVWERVARRADPEGAGPGLDEFLAGMDAEAFAAMRRDVERYMALRPGVRPRHLHRDGPRRAGARRPRDEGPDGARRRRRAAHPRGVLGSGAELSRVALRHLQRPGLRPAVSHPPLHLRGRAAELGASAPPLLARTATST